MRPRLRCAVPSNARQQPAAAPPVAQQPAAPPAGHAGCRLAAGCPHARGGERTDLRCFFLRAGEAKCRRTGIAAGTQARAGLPEARVLDYMSREEIDGLVKRGQDMLAIGDISGGRLLLTRAAEAGDARASFALAGTYDSAVVATLGVVGAFPDAVKARPVPKAVEQGSTELRAVSNSRICVNDKGRPAALLESEEGSYARGENVIGLDAQEVHRNRNGSCNVAVPRCRRFGQAWPARPIKIVAGYPAGGRRICSHAPMATLSPSSSASRCWSKTGRRRWHGRRRRCQASAA